MDDQVEELHIAIIKRDASAVHNLLAKGANVSKLYKGRSALGLAAEIGEILVLSAILSTMADQNSNDEHEHRPKKIRCETVVTTQSSSKIKKNDQRRNTGYYIMVHSDTGDNDNAIEEQTNEEKTPEGMDGLEWDVEIKDNGQENENPEFDSWSSLYRWYADILDRTSEMLQVTTKCDVNQQDDMGKTALHYAAEKGNIAALEMLISAGCQLDIANSQSLTPLHVACRNMKCESVLRLLDAGADVHSRTYNKKTTLHFAAALGDMPTMRMLIAKGATINALDTEDRTPLLEAVRCSETEAVKLLIECGARVNCEDVHGSTPLCEAVWQKCEPMVRALLDAGAKITQSHCLLHYAVRWQDLCMARLLLDAGSMPNHPNNDGNAPIILAVRTGDTNMVKLLLEYGAKINQLSSWGSNVIHEAVEHITDTESFEAMFNVLQDNGADVNLYTCLISELTPLSRALFYERTNTAAILIRHGADVNSYDSLLHQYLLCIARRKKYFYIAKLLVYAGFDVRYSTNDIKPLMKGVSHQMHTLDGWLTWVKYNPLNLTDLCRINIRKQCGSHVYRRVDKMFLPWTLKRFLKLENITD